MGENIKNNGNGGNKLTESDQRNSGESHYPPGLLFMRLEPVPLEGLTMDTARRTDSLLKEDAGTFEIED